MIPAISIFDCENTRYDKTSKHLDIKQYWFKILITECPNVQTVPWLPASQWKMVIMKIIYTHPIHKILSHLTLPSIFCPWLGSWAVINNW
jgi:hypothetical protein